MFRYKAHSVPSKCEFDSSYHEDVTLPDADLVANAENFSDPLIIQHWKIGQIWQYPMGYNTPRSCT